MKLIIFSDIHGNADALEIFLHEVVHGYEKIVFCGDVVGYYYDSDRCVELMRRIENLTAVRGNHDQYYIDAFHNKTLTQKLVKKYGTSYQIKSRDVLAFLESLPLQREMTLNGYRILIQHGALGNLLEGRIYPDSKLQHEMEDTICICGHTHYQMVRKKGSNIWINPGSLGQPRDGRGFSYCVFDMERMETEFYTVAVDITNLLSKIAIHDPDNSYLKRVLYRNERT